MAPLRRLMGTAPARRVARLLPERVRERAGVMLGLRAGDEPAVELLRRDAARRLRAATLAQEREWRTVRTLADWEHFRDRRLAALRRSVRWQPEARSALRVRQTAQRRRDGVVVENLVLEHSVPITANLYRPEASDRPAPAIVICHSHHADKTQSELQDMGLAWALAGCVVLVADVIGHGERRLHPFRSAADYRLPFKVDRQDYFFRFNLGWQLELAGHSLMGRIVADVVRAIDALVERPDVDPDRLILIGAVAGGGDIAATAAALDPRVCGLVSFGVRGWSIQDEASRRIPGPNPPSWELSRNLPRSASDGFLPWLVLCARAPQPLVYAHEFSWDRESDPVWARLQRVYELYGATDRLAAVHGSGSGAGPPPHNTHCNNVGAIHRRGLHPIFERWFGIPAPLEAKRVHFDGADLRCREPQSDTKPDLLQDLAKERAPTPSLQALRGALPGLLGFEAADYSATSSIPHRSRILGTEIIRLRSAASPVVLELELLWPRGHGRSDLPIAIGFCQQGRRALRRKRRSLVRRLRAEGIAVCLTDLRATGPGQGDAVRGRHGLISEVAAAELMLGRTLLGWRLTDLLAVLRYLRGRPEVAVSKRVLWGDSLAPDNATSVLSVPFDAGYFPHLSEPLGGLLALLAGVLEPELCAVVARGAWARFGSLLESPFCYAPFDSIVPGLAALCEVDDLAAAQLGRPLLIDGLVDGLNRSVGQTEVARAFTRTRESYEAAGRSADLELSGRSHSAGQLAGWIIEACLRSDD